MMIAREDNNNMLILGPVVSKTFSLHGGKVKNINQVYELQTTSELNFSLHIYLIKCELNYLQNE